MFVIEPFTTNDLVPVMNLASRTLPEAYSAEFFLTMSRAQGRYFRVARHVEGGRVTGFIVGCRKPGLEGSVLLFAVDPDYRGQGLGRALFRDVQQQLMLDDVRLLNLEVRPDNRNAIQFYQREGFRVGGVEEAVYKDGSDALWMSKPLI
jgi:ribosomal protein S18 acetylase RimI-like enzyme